VAQDKAAYNGTGSDSLIAEVVIPRGLSTRSDLREEFRVIYGICEIWVMPTTDGLKPKRYYTNPQRGYFN